MKKKRVSRVLAWYFYAFIALASGTTGLIAINISPQTEYSNLVKAVSFAILGSAAIIPAIKQLVDNALETFTTEVRDDFRRAELLSSYGILELSNNWKCLVRPGPEGELYKELSQEFLHGSNWYIVTINPKGLMENFLHETLIGALKNGCNVKWAYLQMPNKITSETDLLRNWWITRYDSSMGPDENEAAKIKITRQSVNHNVKTLKNSLRMHFSKGSIAKENFSLYENALPTTYLAVLAIRKLTSEQEIEVISQPLSKDLPGLLLVNPYQMWHMSDDSNMGMVLGKGGELYKQYSTSVLRFFALGEKRRHLRKVWPG